MALGTPDMPVAASGRGTSVAAGTLSYALARGCVKLLNGELECVEIVGDTRPRGLHVVLANGRSEAWAMAEDGGNGRSLYLRGMPFSSQLVNYNFGLMLGLHLMMHREVYPEFA
jgi:hypothetical protein